MDDKLIEEFKKGIDVLVDTNKKLFIICLAFIIGFCITNVMWCYTLKSMVYYPTQTQEIQTEEKSVIQQQN